MAVERRIGVAVAKTLPVGTDGKVAGKNLRVDRRQHVPRGGVLIGGDQLLVRQSGQPQLLRAADEVGRERRRGAAPAADEQAAHGEHACVSHALSLSRKTGKSAAKRCR